MLGQSCSLQDEQSEYHVSKKEFMKSFGQLGRSPKGLALPSAPTFADFSTCPLDATCKAKALCHLMHPPCVNTCGLWLHYLQAPFPALQLVHGVVSMPLHLLLPLFCC